MNLYQIDNEILGCVDADTGEIIDIDKLEELQIERDAKVENLGLWIKNLDAEAEALKAEKMAFAKRQQAAENKRDSLKKYLASYLEGTPFKSTKVNISFRKSETLEITDDGLFDLPDEYLRFKQPDVDKAALKKAIKEGKQFAGVCIVENQNIQIK
jgi:hypothetical protein